MFQPAFGWAQHPKAGQNTQQLFVNEQRKKCERQTQPYLGELDQLDN